MDGFDADEEDEEVESDKEMGLDDEDGDGLNNFDPQSFAEVRAMILTYHLHFSIFWLHALLFSWSSDSKKKIMG